MLAKFKGETPAKFSGNNDETFNSFDAKKWADTVQQLDKVSTDIEKFVDSADDKTMEKIASTVAHIGTHNAYHVGQIIYIRRLQGSWEPREGREVAAARALRASPSGLLTFRSKAPSPMWTRPSRAAFPSLKSTT